LIYVAFTFWLLMILFAGVGIYRLWSQIVRPSWVNWALLPGTFVSEMGYIFGCLVTGGEIRRAQLVPSGGGSRGKGSSDGEPTTEDSPRIKVVGPLVAALLAVAASAGGIVALHTWLDAPVIDQFVLTAGLEELPRELPTTWDGFWDSLKRQIDFLQSMCDSWRALDWANWRVGLLIYLATCLSVRLAPVGRDMRWSLAAMAAVAGLIALAGVVSKRFDGLIREGRIWYLLTYVWTLLLFLLAATLLLRGLIGLVQVLRGGKKRRA